MATYFKSDGTRINLGNKLGQGGEGAVFEIKENLGTVAKVYHTAVSREQVSKLEAMIALQTTDLLQISSWPIGTIHKTKGGDVVGLEMPKIEGYKPVHELYSPKSRRAEFPNADWRFLINTAANISRVFGIIHQHNHIIGDVNHGNLVVAKDGTVKLIDCDSFQVFNNNKYYYCEVGVPEYTPPELASSDFAKAIRNQNHDLFGLAVLNFHLLFLGRHPFAGKFLGNGYMPIDRAIKENRFVYGVNSLAKMMEPPPNTLSMASTSASVANLFETAFNTSSLFTARPTAKDWVNSLVDLSKQLMQCSVSSAHYYVNNLNVCPWCSFEKKLGIDFFQTQKYTAVQNFNIDLVWPRIQQLKRPVYLGLAEKYIINEPSQKAKTTLIKTRYNLLIYALVIAISFAIGIVMNLPGAIAPLLVFGIAIARFLTPQKNKIASGFERNVNDLRVKYEYIINNINSPLREFDIELAELKSIKAEYQNLPLERAKGFEHLKNTIKENQLNKYLEKFEINAAILKNIGEGRKQMLMSFGIETAADVSLAQVSAVPGFGPTFSKILMDWRQACEKGFVFDYSKGVDPQDIAKLDKRVNDKKSQIESRLGSGAQKLQSLLNEFHRLKNSKAEELDRAMLAFQQANFDLGYVRGGI